MIRASSSADRLRPFIFQLPAISGRGALAMPYPRHSRLELAVSRGANRTPAPQGGCRRRSRQSAARVAVAGCPFYDARPFGRPDRKTFDLNLVWSMLRGLRTATSNWLGKSIVFAVVAVLVVSFAIWGIGDIFRGFGRSTLAKIGRTEITVEQFRTLYNERLQLLGRQLGRPVSLEQ